MREVHKTSMKDPATKAIVKAAFPDYHGRKIKFVVTVDPQHFTTWWDGGSKDDVVAIELSTMRVVEFPESSPYEAEGASRQAYRHGLAPLPGIALVNQSIFCGTNTGITIYLHPDNAPKMLPAVGGSESGRHRG
mgnify:CR=1 FL=1